LCDVVLQKVETRFGCSLTHKTQKLVNRSSDYKNW